MTGMLCASLLQVPTFSFAGLVATIRLPEAATHTAHESNDLFLLLFLGAALVLALVDGKAFGPPADRPYLLDLAVWSRFFIALGLFILMERQVEERLRVCLAQFARAPLLAPTSFEAAAKAVTRALRRRDFNVAEALCLLIAALLGFVTLHRLLDSDTAIISQIDDSQHGLREVFAQGNAQHPIRSPEPVRVNANLWHGDHVDIIAVPCFAFVQEKRGFASAADGNPVQLAHLIGGQVDACPDSHNQSNPPCR